MSAAILFDQNSKCWRDRNNETPNQDYWCTGYCGRCGFVLAEYRYRTNECRLSRLCCSEFVFPAHRGSRHYEGTPKVWKRIPRVEGYRVELPEEKLTANFTLDSVLELTPNLVGPSSTEVREIIGGGQSCCRAPQGHAALKLALQGSRGNRLQPLIPGRACSATPR